MVPDSMVIEKAWRGLDSDLMKLKHERNLSLTIDTIKMKEELESFWASL